MTASGFGSVTVPSCRQECMAWSAPRGRRFRRRSAHCSRSRSLSRQVSRVGTSSLKISPLPPARPGKGSCTTCGLGRWTMTIRMLIQRWE